MKPLMDHASILLRKLRKQICFPARCLTSLSISLRARLQTLNCPAFQKNNDILPLTRPLHITLRPILTPQERMPSTQTDSMNLLENSLQKARIILAEKLSQEIFSPMDHITEFLYRARNFTRKVGQVRPKWLHLRPPP